MQFKNLPLFLLSAALLSGCTKGCEGDHKAPTPPAAPAAPKSESAMVPEQQNDVAVNTEDAATDSATDE